MIATLYNNEGFITKVFNGDNPELQGEFGFVEGHSVDTLQYIPDPLNPVITDKPPSPITISTTSVTADGTTEVIVGSIPVDAECVLEGDTMSIREVLTSDTLELTFDTPDVYTLTIEAFPYLPYEVQINAT